MGSASIAAAAFAQAPTSGSVSSGARYLPQYTASGELILPKNSIWREWVFVGSPLTPNALNGGHANFPEYHNVYIEPGSYATYKKTNVFPEGTIMFKELQLTKKPEENPDGSRTEPSGRGYFPGAFNGADVTVKDSKRFAASGGWGFFDFNHFEPKAPTQGYRICILPNWARRRVRKVSSKAARMRFPFMDPLEPSSLARFRARRRSRAIFCGL